MSGVILALLHSLEQGARTNEVEGFVYEVLVLGYEVSGPRYAVSGIGSRAVGPGCTRCGPRTRGFADRAP